MTADDLLRFIRARAQKFIDKVESGNTRSKETYADMKEIVYRIDAHLASGGQSLDAQSVAERVRELCAKRAESLNQRESARAIRALDLMEILK